MTNYTDGQIESVSRYLRGCGKAQGADIIDSLLAERQAAKAGVVTDAIAKAACIAYNDQSMQANDAQYVCMRAALASVWPTAGGDGKWISVLDRQPVDSNRYLCIFMDGIDHHGIAIRYWIGKDWLDTTGNHPVAYWMTLPQTWMVTFGTSDKVADKIEYLNRIISHQKSAIAAAEGEK